MFLFLCSFHMSPEFAESVAFASSWRFSMRLQEIKTKPLFCSCCRVNFFQKTPGIFKFKNCICLCKTAPHHRCNLASQDAKSQIVNMPDVPVAKSEGFRRLFLRILGIMLKKKKQPSKTGEDGLELTILNFFPLKY